MSDTGTSVCATCHARCCFAYAVHVTGHDVWLIARRLRLDAAQFVVALDATEHQPNAFRLDRSGRAFVLALGKQRVENPQGEWACVFWLPLPGGSGRCGIYAERPNVCRTYPAYLRDGAVHLRRDAACPPRAWSVAGLDLASWRRELERGDREKQVYETVVQSWNERIDQPVSLGVFYDYLLTAYDELAINQAPT